MKINITGDGLELTPAFKEYIENHLGTLNKLLGRYDADAVQVHVIAARTTRHHAHGDVYECDIQMNIPNKKLVAKSDAADPRVAVDSAVDKLKHELVKHKEMSSDH